MVLSVLIMLISHILMKMVTRPMFSKILRLILSLVRLSVFLVEQVLVNQVWFSSFLVFMMWKPVKLRLLATMLRTMIWIACVSKLPWCFKPMSFSQELSRKICAGEINRRQMKKSLKLVRLPKLMNLSKNLRMAMTPRLNVVVPMSQGDNVNVFVSHVLFS